MKLKIIVVLYKKKLSESQTLLSLQEQVDLKDLSLELCIYDNSPEPYLSEGDLNALSNNYSVLYTNLPENESLSRIYEKGFASYQDGEYLLLLDDDSNLPDNYLSVFYSQQALIDKPVVYVPKILVDNKILSPYHSNFIFSNPVSAKSCGLNNEVTAINSGIFVPLTYMQSLFKYPEHCQFYGTDSVLFEYFHKQGVDIFVLDIFFKHDLSFHPSSDGETYLRSLTKVVKFWRAHYANNFRKKTLLKIYLIYLSVKVSLKFKKIINLLQVGC